MATAAGTIWWSAGRSSRSKTVIERMDSVGRVHRAAERRAGRWSPACSPDGKVWYYPAAPAATRASSAAIASGCRDIYQGFALGLSASPDGKRLAFITMDTRGSTVQWITPRAASCTTWRRPKRAARSAGRRADTIWVSRRRGRKIVWTEVDADTASRDRQDGAREPRLLRRAARPGVAGQPGRCASSTTRRRRCGCSGGSTWSWIRGGGRRQSRQGALASPASDTARSYGLPRGRMLRKTFQRKRRRIKLRPIPAGSFCLRQDEREASKEPYEAHQRFVQESSGRQHGRERP